MFSVGCDNISRVHRLKITIQTVFSVQYELKPRK